MPVPCNGLSHDCAHISDDCSYSFHALSTRLCLHLCDPTLPTPTPTRTTPALLAVLVADAVASAVFAGIIFFLSLFRNRRRLCHCACSSDTEVSFSSVAAAMQKAARQTEPIPDFAKTSSLDYWYIIPGRAPEEATIRAYPIHAWICQSQPIT